MLRRLAGHSASIGRSASFQQDIIKIFEGLSYWFGDNLTIIEEQDYPLHFESSVTGRLNGQYHA